jgi:phage terminase small subunit
MPMPRKPLALKELHGTAKDHPSRNNQQQPVVVRGIGPAPEYFDEATSATWDYLVSVMFVGVLSESDRPSFEMMAKLFHRFRYGSYDDDSVLPALAVGELARLDSLFSRYGMTPSDRTRLVIPKTEKKNSFEAL